MSKYTFTINGERFSNARKALAQVGKVKKAGGKIKTIRVNGEPLLLSELESEAHREKAEAAHNKRQGL